MLDMGFIDDIETIVAATPADRQFLLFSATWDSAVGKLAASSPKNPEVVGSGARGRPRQNRRAAFILQQQDAEKPPAHNHILRDANIDQAVIFTSTKVMSEQLADESARARLLRQLPARRHAQGWRNPHVDGLAQRPH